MGEARGRASILCYATSDGLARSSELTTRPAFSAASSEREIYCGDCSKNSKVSDGFGKKTARMDSNDNSDYVNFMYARFGKILQGTSITTASDLMPGHGAVES
ncbi:hypothetical protein Y032_0069g354 [Ancylostoma ceylanicum]|nr:hypothetical protein Y032_0069g354 [Ancylostoma ceylanicum]